MPTEEEIGKKIVKAVWMNKKHGDVFFDKLQKQLNRLNVKTTKETTKLYNKVLSSLDLKDKLVENSVDNLSKVRVLMLGIDDIQRIYKRQYGGLTREARKESQELLKAREDRITKLLSKVGIVEQDRSLTTAENFNLMGMLATQGYKRINQTLEKWKNFAYDTFYIGVTRGMNVADFKSLFYTDAGTLKIGSSLVQESEMETMISITEQRTAFLRQRAKELGYKYCWNSNPMDMRTKGRCIDACLSGIITEAEMGERHSFPPRYICRCELVYTRGEWTGVNKGVNEAIEERRLYLLEELKSAPGQLAKWKRKGVPGWIVPKEALRAAGLKPYKEIEDKIKLIEGKEVPEFKIKEVKVIKKITKKEIENIIKEIEDRPRVNMFGKPQKDGLYRKGFFELHPFKHEEILKIAKVIEDKEEKLGIIKKIKIDKKELVGIQGAISPKQMRYPLEHRDVLKKPIVVKYKKMNIIFDGHHRLTADLLFGIKERDVLYIDFDTIIKAKK